MTLHWRHNGHDSVSNHQPQDCLINCLFRRRSKKISKLRVTGLCAGNSPKTGEFPTQMAGNAENVSIWWRHHECNLSMGSSTLFLTLFSDIRQNLYLFEYILSLSLWRLFVYIFNDLQIYWQIYKVLFQIHWRFIFHACNFDLNRRYWMFYVAEMTYAR